MGQTASWGKGCGRRQPDGAAAEEDNPFQPLVVEEVVKGPQAAILPKRVRVQVRVVAGESEGRGCWYEGPAATHT